MVMEEVFRGHTGLGVAQKVDGVTLNVKYTHWGTVHAPVERGERLA